MDREKKEIATTYLHISNSGVSFTISDYYGPTVSIESSCFGNLQQSFSFATNRNGLKALRDVIDKALEHEFSDPYCHAALPPRPCTGCDQSENND